MPGGYGTEDTPWGTSGDTAQPGPVRSPVSTPSGAPPVTIGSQPTTPFVDNTFSYNTDNPYYTTGDIVTGQMIPEAKPVKLKDYGELAIMNKFAEQFAGSLGDPTNKYAKAMQGSSLAPPGTPASKMPVHPLSKLIMTDSGGAPILDKSGNPIYTGLGKHLKDEWDTRMKDPKGPGEQEWDIASESKFAPGFFGKEYSRETLEDIESDYFRKRFYEEQQGDKGWQPQRQMSQRERNAKLLQFLNAGLPIKNLEQSGFMESMKDPYSEDVARTGKEGIFKEVIPGGAFTPDAMRRLIKTFGSGLTSPRYANVARGGIMSVWNDRR